MNIFEHHTDLDSGWVLDAAAGNAPRAVELFVECHAALNKEAKQSFETAEALLGELLETAPVSSMSPGALDRVFQELENDIELPQPQGSFDPDEIYPAPLQRVLNFVHDGEWKQRFGGYSEIVLDELCEPGVSARLLSIPKGRGAPEHDHGAEEGTLVLSGSFTDGHGHYARGDACMVGAGTVHHPVVDSEEPCICLAVELGELKPTNPVYAVLKKFMSDQ